jgi:hypothetical protein
MQRLHGGEASQVEVSILRSSSLPLVGSPSSRPPPTPPSMAAAAPAGEPSSVASTTPIDKTLQLVLGWRDPLSSPLRCKIGATPPYGAPLPSSHSLAILTRRCFRLMGTHHRGASMLHACLFFPDRRALASRYTGCAPPPPCLAPVAARGTPAPVSYTSGNRRPAMTEPTIGGKQLHDGK